MDIRCPNCKEVFTADANQEWTVKKTIENNLDNVIIKCQTCGKGFIIDREKIFDNNTIVEKELEKKDRKARLISDGSIKIAPVQPVRQKYRSEVLSLLRANEIVVNKTNTTSDFYYSITNVGRTHSEVIIEIDKIITDFGLEELNKYRQLFDKINSPKNTIRFLITTEGMITDVLNKKEIEDNWQVAKKDLQQDAQFNALSKEDREKILKAGDEEYLNVNKLTDQINTGHSLYALLFNGFWRSYTVKENYKLRTQNKASLLFKDELLPIEFEAKMKRFDYENFTAQIEVQGIEAEDFKYKKFEHLYKEAYPFATKPLDQYNYDMLCDYEISELSGIINHFNITVIEEAGGIEMFLDCKVKRINEKSNTSQ